MAQESHFDPFGGNIFIFYAQKPTAGANASLWPLLGFYYPTFQQVNHFWKKKRKNKKIKVTYRFEFILSPVEFCEEGPIVFGLVYHHLLQTCRQFLQISEDILHGRYHL